MPRARRCLLRPSLAALSLSLLLGTAQAETALFSADGYRIGLYRSPTPTQLQGASIIDTPALQDLLKQLDETLRRVSAQSVLLSDTVAKIVGLNSTDLECLDLLDIAGPTTAGRLAEHGEHLNTSIAGSHGSRHGRAEAQIFCTAYFIF